MALALGDYTCEGYEDEAEEEEACGNGERVEEGSLLEVEPKAHKACERSCVFFVREESGGDGVSGAVDCCGAD
jgi:hypothetical protein